MSLINTYEFKKYVIKQHLHIKTFYGTTKNAVYTIWIAICDYLLLIIAKKHYMLNPSLHSISNSIGQVRFKREDIFNQTDLTDNVPEGDGPSSLYCGKISPDSSELSVIF